MNMKKDDVSRLIFELGLIFGIIIGRWLMPRGKMTRDQLSALLIGYVGTAADIVGKCFMISYQKGQIFSPCRDVGSVSNLEGHDTARALFLMKKGAFSEKKKSTSLFIAKSWGGTCPSAPRFLRL